MFGLQRWKPGILLASWVAYWAVLIGITIGPGLLKAWRLTHAPGSHGAMSASFGSEQLLFNVNDAAAATAWSFSTSVAAAVAWIAIPPLALWVLWLISRSRRDARPAVLRGADPLTRAPAATSSRRASEPVERGT